MIIQLTINLQTLETVSEDPTATINSIKVEDGFLTIEISKPDPETTLPTGL